MIVARYVIQEQQSCLAEEVVESRGGELGCVREDSGKTGDETKKS